MGAHFTPVNADYTYRIHGIKYLFMTADRSHEQNRMKIFDSRSDPCHISSTSSHAAHAGHIMPMPVTFEERNIWHAIGDVAQAESLGRLIRIAACSGSTLSKQQNAKFPANECQLSQPLTIASSSFTSFKFIASTMARRLSSSSIDKAFHDEAI